VADALNLIELRQTCMNFIETYFEQVALSKSFLRLEACVILEIVLKDTLVVPREEVVYEAIQRWGAYSPEARTEPLKQLLSFVRFPLMGKIVIFILLSSTQI
jgi:kelch-like protein 24/35